MHRKGKVQLIDASQLLAEDAQEPGQQAQGDVRRAHRHRHEAVRGVHGGHLATILDADGKEIGREVLRPGKAAPVAPEGGKVRVVPISRIFDNRDFGYRTITVERPMRDETGMAVLGKKGKLKGKLQPDTSLRDTENVPLSEDVEAYFKREVLPHAPDAWIDHEKTKVGYEIPFNRHFYVFEPPRPLAEIDADLKRHRPDQARGTMTALYKDSG
jgi:type I restriction enzyme M protein